jgi:hypothetical protein
MSFSMKTDEELDRIISTLHPGHEHYDRAIHERDFRLKQKQLNQKPDREWYEKPIGSIFLNVLAAVLGFLACAVIQYYFPFIKSL